MSKKHRKFREILGLSGEDILGMIQTRANGRAAERGHLLGMWHPAKKKYGKAAKRACCLSCGRIAIITPYGNPNGPKVAQWGPVILGTAIFETCPPVEGKQPPVQQKLLTGHPGPSGGLL